MSKLQKAVRNRDLSLVGKLVHGASPEDLNESLLEAACTKDAQPICETLLDAGASLVQENSWPLMLRAVSTGQKDMVEWFLARGVSVEGRDESGITGLMAAAGNGHPPVVEALIAAGAELNRRDDRGRTALARACESGCADSAEHLIDAGADLEAATIAGDTPLLLAMRSVDIVYGRFREIVRRLLFAGANVDHRNQALESAWELIEHVGLPEPLDETHEMAREELQRLVAELRDRSAAVSVDPDVQARDRWHELLAAVRGDDLAAARSTLDAGAEVDRGDDVHHRALYHCKSSAMLELLLEAGASPSARVKPSSATLWYLQQGRIDLARVLRDRGGALMDDEQEYDLWFTMADRAASKEYEAAVAALVTLCGSQPIRDDNDPPGLFRFPVQEPDVVRDRAREQDLGGDCFVFRDLQGSEGKDCIGVLPVRDSFEAILGMGTAGVNQGLMPPQVAQWMRDLSHEYPLTIQSLGSVQIAGCFDEPVKDPAPLAKRISDFCPDVIHQGSGSIKALAKEIERTQRFSFWWD